MLQKTALSLYAHKQNYVDSVGLKRAHEVGREKMVEGQRRDWRRCNEGQICSKLMQI